MPFPLPAAPRRAMRACALSAAAFALAGCAALQPKTPEQVVQERAEARWAALMKGDFERAWTYADPAYREQVEQAHYKGRFGDPRGWKSLTVHSVKCEPERCTARIRLTTANIAPTFMRKIPELTTYSDEAWVRQDGQWWYLHSRESAPAAPAPAQTPSAPAPSVTK
ncbi:MAG: hypothetical protein Q4G71_07100 [Pseudomonadota bacterium]|nr:hypothetical protein [Pseudomonadota bacterium]